MDDKQRATYFHAVKSSFEFLKRTSSLDMLWTKSIPLSDGAGFLLPVADVHANDHLLIETLARWREDHAHVYPTQFPVTIDGTKSWLVDRLLNVPDRMLFLVVDPNGHWVGHLGFAGCLNDDGLMEFDNLLRGSLQGRRDIMQLAIKAMFEWAQNTIGPNGFYCRVLSGLKRVMTMEKELGFVEVSRTPLRKHVHGEALSLEPVTEDDDATPDDWFVRLEYRPEAKWNGDSMILTAGPSISARESSYAFDAARSGWNGQWNKYLKQFEESFASYLGRKYAIATSSCTGALHLSLLALGIGPGDEVIVPDITWVATANAVLYTGATPVFADIEKSTWCLDPNSVEALITDRTKAIMPVHLYGHPARMDNLVALATKYGLAIVEDAAPAIGAECNGRKAGTFGDFACFSFQGAKLLVTGEGGMLVTDDDRLFERVQSLWDQGRDPRRTFWISDNGWKYKMSNVQAAIGLGQLERADELIEMKRRLHSWFAEEFDGVEGIELFHEADYARSIHWMTSITVNPESGIDREAFRAALKQRNIDTRPVFPAISQYPIWPTQQPTAPVAKFVGDHALNLPSGVLLRREQIAYIGAQIRDLIYSAKLGRSAA